LRLTMMVPSLVSSPAGSQGPIILEIASQGKFATYMDPPTMSSGGRTETRKRTDAVIYPAC
jgi:hypothetical protein